jgi:hypothetical protein
MALSFMIGYSAIPAHDRHKLPPKEATIGTVILLLNKSSAKKCELLCPISHAFPTHCTSQRYASQKSIQSPRANHRAFQQGPLHQLGTDLHMHAICDI